MTSPRQQILDKILQPRQGIWIKDELPIGAELMSYAPKLREEFLAIHPEFLSDDHSQLTPYTARSGPDDQQHLDAYPIKGTGNSPKGFVKNADTWKIEGIKYTFPRLGVDLQPTDEIREKFPTACELTAKYCDHIASYSVITPQSSIDRHTGVENEYNKHLRIHIPLIVPEGDIFLECEGVEVTWNDLFGFDNSLVHSAHNFSTHLRLIFIIDVRRDLLGLPPGMPHDPVRQRLYPPFVRGEKPKRLHPCEVANG